jgi:hypothetical protein
VSHGTTPSLLRHDSHLSSMEALSAAAASAGIPVGSQRFLATTVAGPLVGYVLAVIKSVSASADTVHVASTVLGLAQCVFVYSSESTILLLGPVLLCYALMAAGRRHAGTSVFVASFAYLLFWCVVPPLLVLICLLFLFARPH